MLHRLSALPILLACHAGSGRVDVAAVRARAIKGAQAVDRSLRQLVPRLSVAGGVMDLPQLRDFAAHNLEVVTADIGRSDQNLDVPAPYGLKGRLAGVPALSIVDPKTNRLINRGRETALADARSLTPQALAGWTA